MRLPRPVHCPLRIPPPAEALIDCLDELHPNPPTASAAKAAALLEVLWRHGWTLTGARHVWAAQLALAMSLLATGLVIGRYAVGGHPEAIYQVVATLALGIALGAQFITWLTPGTRPVTASGADAPTSAERATEPVE